MIKHQKSLFSTSTIYIYYYINYETGTEYYTKIITKGLKI